MRSSFIRLQRFRKQTYHADGSIPFIQREHFEKFFFSCQRLRHPLTQRRPVFETVARTTAQQKEILRCRVKIENEISIGAVFIGANAAFAKRCVLEQRETMGQELTRALQCIRGQRVIAVRGVEELAAVLKSVSTFDFKTAVGVARDAVVKIFSIHIHPNRHALKRCRV